MMAAPRFPETLLDRLPAVRGRLTANAPMAKHTWFRVGGPAEVLFEPADVADLSAFMAGRPADVPLTVIGVGSNLLVRDGGVPGVVIRLGKAFAGIDIDGEAIRCGAAAMDMHVARAAQDAALGGLEFLSGIPGTIGGAVKMNAGAYGTEIADVLIEAQVMDGAGAVTIAPATDLGFAYRHSNLAEDMIVVGARLQAAPDAPDAIAARMEKIRTERADSQPLGTRTGGSTFANPPGEKAWQLVDRVGGRGEARGGASFSDKHCNFLINNGTATAADIEDLGEDIRRRVLAETGIELHWEIRRIGERGQA